MESPPEGGEPEGQVRLRNGVSVETLWSIVNSIADPIFVKDRQHRWVILNDAGCKIIGHSREELIGKSDYDYFPKEQADVFWRKDEEVFETGRENINEEEITGADGVRHIIVTKKTLFAASDGNKYIVGVIRDITDHKKADEELHKYKGHLEEIVEERTAELTGLTERLKQDVTERERAEEVLHRRAKMLEALYEIILSSQQADNLQQFLSSVLRSTITFLDFDGGRIYLVNKIDGTAKVICDINLPPEFLDEVRILKVDTKPYDQVFLHGVPLITDNYGQLAPERAAKFGFKSLASIPIIWKNQTVGALNITSRKRHIISEDEKTVLLTICQELGTIIEKMRAEEALRESEERYRLLSESSQDFIFIVGKDWRVQYVNAAGAKQFRCSQQELIGRPLRDIFPPDVYERQQTMLNTVFESGQSIYIESSSRFPSMEMWLDTLLIPLKDRERRVSSVLGISRDFTDRKNMEDALKESEERYRQLVELSPMGIAVHSEGKIVFANTAGAKIMGTKTVEELIGRSLLSFVCQDYRDFVKDRVKQMMAGKTMQPAEEKFIREDGKVVDVEVAAMPLTFNNKPSIQVIFRDITDRKKAEIALMESEEKYRHIVENSMDGIGIAQQGRIIYVNKAYCGIFGYEPEELVGESLLKVVAPKDRPLIGMRAGLRVDSKRVPNRYVFTGLNKKGERRDIEVASSKVFTYQGKPTILAVLRDITDQKKAENALMESEEKYRSVVENANDGIAILQDGRLKFANSKLTRITGYSMKELIDAPLGRFMSPGELSKVRNYHQRRLVGKPVPKTYETILRHKNGTHLDVEFNATRVTYQDKSASLVVIRDITERKRIEDALKESEGKYRTLIDALPPAVMIFQDGKIAFANPASLKIFKYGNLKEIIGKDYLSPVPPREMKRVRKEVRDRLKGRSAPGHYLTTLTRKDGQEFPAEIFVKKITYLGRSAIQIIVFDVTERKRAEEALKESERRYKGLVESQKDLVVRVDSEGRFTFVNDAYCRKFGKKREELIGKKFHPLVYEEDIERTLEAMKGLEVPPYRIYVEQRAHTTEGLRWIGWEDYSIKDEKGKTTEIQAVGRDIHESKLADMEIAEIKSHLEAILDGISESIVVLDGKYHIVSHNKAFQKWVGGRKEGLKGMTCYRVIHGLDKSCRKCVVRDVFKTGKPAESVHYHQTKKGRMYHETRAYPIIHDAKIVEAIYLFRDVTDRERMKEQLRGNYEQLVKANEELMKLDKMKTEFLSIASHELRTPLAIIKGYADILVSGALGSFNADQRNKIDRISSNVEHLNILVDNILDLTRMDAGELKLVKTKFPAGKLVEEVVGDMAQLASEKRIRLTSGVGVKSLLLADRSRIKQLLVNLIDNSLKFTPEGGRVKVSLTEKKGVLAITVSDTGIGIKKKEQDNIFKRFYQVDSSMQRRYKGSGLGLAICKRIVELHGGTIKAKSVLKKGTKMIVTLPLH